MDTIVETQILTIDESFYMESGRMLDEVEVAYECYGKLNEKKDNVILVAHALSGSANAAGHHINTDRKGWWDGAIGEGKALDTAKYYIICTNVLGSCYGTTGPSSINPRTRLPYAMTFPVVTVADMVTLQRRLLGKLGIDHLFAVIGGSLGGMQALEWAVKYPDFMDVTIPIATTVRSTPYTIAFNKVGRSAIKADPKWKKGNYYGTEGPVDGLAIARMAGHITYLSYESMNAKFGRRFSKNDGIYDINGEYEVEKYLGYNGYAFTKRFDANSYLYISKALDLFNIGRNYGAVEWALERIRAKTLLITFSSDQLYFPIEMEEIFKVMQSQGKDVVYEVIASSWGHDAFLIETEKLDAVLSGYLSKARKNYR